MRRILIIFVTFLICVEACNAKMYNDGYRQFYQINEKLSKESIRYTTRITKKTMKEINFDCKVIISPYSLNGAWGYTNTINRYICIATPNRDYRSILDTVLHEIGHMKMLEVDMREYARYVYNEKYQHFDEWGMRFEEEFAEDFRIYILRTRYTDIVNNFDVYKHTKRPYSSKATRFLSRIILR